MSLDSHFAKLKCVQGVYDGLGLQTGTLLGGDYYGNLIAKGVHTSQTYMRQIDASNVSFFIYT